MPHRVDAPLSLAATVVALLDLGLVALGLALAVAVAARAWPLEVHVPQPRAATAQDARGAD